MKHEPLVLGKSQYFTLVRKRAWPGADAYAVLSVWKTKIFVNVLIMLYFCIVVFKNIIVFKIFERGKII